MLWPIFMSYTKIIFRYNFVAPLKAVKPKNEVLLQYYHEQVISVIDRTKKLSDAELIIKLATSSVGEHIFRDLRSKTYIPSEEKTSADGRNGRLIALK